MDQAAVLEVSREVFFVILKTGGPIMAAGLIVGLIIAVFQTLTSIQEMTLTFVPKMVIIFATLAATAQWMGGTLRNFTEMCFTGFPKVLP